MKQWHKILDNKKNVATKTNNDRWVLSGEDQIKSNKKNFIATVSRLYNTLVKGFYFLFFLQQVQHIHDT